MCGRRLCFLDGQSLPNTGASENLSNRAVHVRGFSDGAAYSLLVSRRSDPSFDGDREGRPAEFDGARGAALAFITAAARYSEGLPIILQTGGGAAVQWLCGFAEDSDGPLVLEPDGCDFGPAPLTWGDLPNMLAESQRPFVMLSFRVTPIGATTRSKFHDLCRRGEDATVAKNGFAWLPELSKWAPPDQTRMKWSQRDLAHGNALVQAIRESEARIRRSKSDWGQRDWDAV